MKYLKKYEKNIFKTDKYKGELKVGDYIIFKDKYMIVWKNLYKGLFNCGKIIKGDGTYTIEVSTLNGNDKFYLGRNFFERKASEKEKAELKLRLAANKYNI